MVVILTTCLIKENKTILIFLSITLINIEVLFRDVSLLNLGLSYRILYEKPW